MIDSQSQASRAVKHLLQRRGEGRDGWRLQDIRAIYPRSWERSSKFHSESGDTASPCHSFFIFFSRQFIETWQAPLLHVRAQICVAIRQVRWHLGSALMLHYVVGQGGLSDEILKNEGEEEEVWQGMCFCSPSSSSLWLRSRAQQSLVSFIFMVQRRLHLV